MTAAPFGKHTAWNERGEVTETGTFGGKGREGTSREQLESHKTYVTVWRDGRLIARPRVE